MLDLCRGPGKKYFLLDRHHAALALTQDKAECVQVGLVRDLSALSTGDFSVFLDHYSWMHCYDAKGQRHPLDEEPDRFEGMKDDPYRSLAGELRDGVRIFESRHSVPGVSMGEPSEAEIPLALLKTDPKKALSKALKLAPSKQCSFLPGWSGQS